MVSQTTRYALLILGYLVSREDRLCPGEQIARDTQIPANYLSKILNQLRKSGLVEAQKGWGGGFRVRGEARDRPILDIVAIFEGNQPTGVPSCVFGLPQCDDKNPCPLHPYWSQIKAQFGEMLMTTTVGQLRRADADAEAGGSGVDGSGRNRHEAGGPEATVVEAGTTGVSGSEAGRPEADGPDS